MKKVFWFFNEGKAYYEDQCVKALAENRIVEVYDKKTYKSIEDSMRMDRADVGVPYTPAPYLEEGETRRPYVVITEREWENLVAEANRRQMDIVNSPDMNLPVLAMREPVDPNSRESLEAELAKIDSRFKELDYIGVKIATGRASISDYTAEITEMDELARRKDEIKAELAAIKAEEGNL